MRLFIFNGYVINVDNDDDAERLAVNPLTIRELTPPEISEIFGTYAHLAGPDSTTVDQAGNVTFTLPSEYTALSDWIDIFVRPIRDAKLLASDKYMISDYPITEIVRAEWQTYRQALRDLPGTLSVIVDPIPWPAEPV